MSTVVTGEGVVLDLHEAGFATRSVGCALDYLAYGLGLGLSLWAASGLLGGLDAAAGRALGIGLAVAWLVAAPAAVETLSRGKSLGRWAMGLRIVRDDGGSIRFRHAFVRAMLAVLEILVLFGSLALVVAFVHPRGKRLGDLLAGTYSMRERAPRHRPVMPPVPPHLRAWAELADVGRIPDHLAARVWRFGRQASAMLPDSRGRLAAALADEVGRHVAPAPPPGTAAEEFLVAVMAERRERDHRRLAAVKERQRAVAGRVHRLPYAGP